MRQTLFYLPHQIGPMHLFGWVSWSMMGLLIYIIFLVVSGRKSDRWRVLQENAFNWGIGVLILGWLLPSVESRLFAGTADETVIGLPVRGYGMMLMLGVIAAVAIANRRIERIGISRDAFLSLALWVIVGGLVGARLFYVVQKWDELGGPTLLDKLKVALQFTEGGLVVYGSVLGGMAGLFVWTWRNRVRPIPLLDAVVPAFFIGLALGRIGCLLNGCCYGGVCGPHLPSITFPPGSPAYMDQLEHGRLLGIRTRNAKGEAQEIESVDTQGWAATQGLKTGQTLKKIDIYVQPPSPKNPTAPPELEASLMVDSNRIEVPTQVLPARSLPVHPSQIYASISGFLLCLWTLSIAHWEKRPGLVFGAGWVAYGIVRLLEEIIRDDELGVFETSLTISQWVSVLGIAMGLFILFWTCRFGFRPQQIETTS